jgi:hypothetical protein
MKHLRQLDWWYYRRLRVAWVRFKMLLHKPLTATEKIQYAIDTGTKYIHLHAGIYNLQHPINVKNGVHIFGDD